jgi:hypothetical protein
MATADHAPSVPLDDNDVIEEEPNGVIDFSHAVPQKDGSVCITKTKYIEKMEKQPVKECWYTWDRCYDYLNIFAEKFSEKFGVFDSKQS